MKGRPAKPTELHWLHGTYRADRHGNTPDPKGEPEAPPHLDERAKEVWQTLGKNLIQIGVLTSIDGALFATFCQTQSDLEKAEAGLSETGLVTRTPSGTAELSPYFGAVQRLRDTLRKLATELGLTPQSRAKIHVYPNLAQDSDDFAEIDSILGFPANGSKIWKRNRRGTA